MFATNTPSLPTVLAVIAGWYAVVPLIVWRKLPRGKAWETEPFDPARHEMSPAITEFLRVNLSPLLEAGFRQAGDLVHRGARSKTRVAVLGHPDGAVATIVAVSAAPRVGLTVPRTVMMVEFTAVLTTGTVLDVNNSPSVPIFPVRSDHIVYRFPQIRDPLRLYHFYELMLRRTFSSATLAQQDLSDPVAYLKRATEREYRRQIDTGYYRFNEATREYIQTLKGAYITAWKLMVPFKQIRAALFARKSRALLSEVEIAAGEFNSRSPAPRA